eukprot:766588-Hanusia_phi.AAC.1
MEYSNIPSNLCEDENCRQEAESRVAAALTVPGPGPGPLAVPSSEFDGPGVTARALPSRVTNSSTCPCKFDNKG